MGCGFCCGDDAPVTWDTVEGMKKGITAQNKGSFTNGIIDFTDTSGSALFTLALPCATAATGTKTIKITYICQVTTGNPDVTLKDGGWGAIATTNGTDGCNWYQTLTVNAVTVLELSEKWYTDATATISFQRNGDTNAFKIKIISVTMN